MAWTSSEGGEWGNYCLSVSDKRWLLHSLLPWKVIMLSFPLDIVTSRNTPVTMLTNFWLVPGHAVTSFVFQDSRNLGFALDLDARPPTLLALTSSSHQAISGSSGSQKIPTPDPISYYSLSLASYSCPTLLSCVLYSCNIASLCLPIALPIPPT